MNKLFNILAALMVLFVVGCTSNNGNSKAEGKRLKSMADYDIVYLENGNLVFYNIDLKRGYTYKNEKDSVVNAAFLNDSVLYYTVSTNKNLVLKSLVLNDQDVQPEKVLDWNLKVDDCENIIDGNLGDMCFNPQRTKIALYSDMVSAVQMYSKLSVFDLQSKTLRQVVLFKYNPETGEIIQSDDAYDFTPNYDANLYGQDFEFDEFGNLYYIKNGTKISMTDQLVYRDIFRINPKSSDKYVNVYPVSTDPQISKVLFTARLPWGNYKHSTYCVSTLDGLMQLPLDAAMTKVAPKWIKNGALVFVAQQRDNEGKLVTKADGKPACQVKVMDPSGQISIIGDACDFAVKSF